MSHNSLELKTRLMDRIQMANSSPGFCSLLLFANLIALQPKSNKSKCELGLEHSIFRRKKKVTYPFQITLHKTKSSLSSRFYRKDVYQDIHLNLLDYDSFFFFFFFFGTRERYETDRISKSKNRYFNRIWEDRSQGHIPEKLMQSRAHIKEQAGFS